MNIFLVKSKVYDDFEIRNGNEIMDKIKKKLGNKFAIFYV